VSTTEDNSLLCGKQSSCACEHGSPCCLRENLSGRGTEMSRTLGDCRCYRRAEGRYSPGTWDVTDIMLAIYVVLFIYIYIYTALRSMENGKSV
jgi:hypothetical protein